MNATSELGKGCRIEQQTPARRFRRSILLRPLLFSTTSKPLPLLLALPSLGLTLSLAPLPPRAFSLSSGPVRLLKSIAVHQPPTCLVVQEETTDSSDHVLGTQSPRRTVTLLTVPRLRHETPSLDNLHIYGSLEFGAFFRKQLAISGY
jgi:hypothetical protein